nr:UBN2 domain-containing protein [Tanacetum cinerariifolium]
DIERVLMVVDYTVISDRCMMEVDYRNKDEDAYEHVEKVLEIVSIFNVPGVTQDAVAYSMSHSLALQGDGWEEFQPGLSIHGKCLKRAKVTTIEELNDLSSLAPDEPIGNLKVHEVVMEKDSKIYKGKKERVKFISLKAKKESSDDETLTSESDDEECAMALRNFKKFFRRKGKFVRQPREEKKSFRQREEKKERVTENALDAVIQIISLAIIQNYLATKIKRPLLEVLGAIEKMTPKTNLMMKLVSWINRQMRPSTENATDGSTIKAHGSTIPGSMSRTVAEKVTYYVFSPPMSSRSDFVVNRKKLIHNIIDESKKPS